MSLYNDLTDVLTPYANKIKEVNESLGPMADSYVGLVMQRAVSPTTAAGAVIDSDGDISTVSGTTRNIKYITIDDIYTYVVINAKKTSSNETKYAFYSSETYAECSSETAVLVGDYTNNVDTVVEIPDDAKILCICCQYVNTNGLYFKNIETKIKANMLAGINVVDRSMWEVGSINTANGAAGTSIKRVRTKAVIPGYVYSFAMVNGWKYLPFAWDSNGDFVGTYDQKTDTHSKGATFFTGSFNVNDYYRKYPTNKLKMVITNEEDQTDVSGADNALMTILNSEYVRTELANRVNINQPISDAGKILVVGSDGELTLTDPEDIFDAYPSGNADVNLNTFVSKMNEYAARIGMSNTNLLDPAGLNDSAEITVRDMVRMGIAACGYPEIMRIWGLDSATIVTHDSGHISHAFSDHTSAWSSYESTYHLYGMKAGGLSNTYTLVAACQIGENVVVGAIGGAESRPYRAPAMYELMQICDTILSGGTNSQTVTNATKACAAVLPANPSMYDKFDFDWIYEQNADDVIAPASTAKLITCMIALDWIHNRHEKIKILTIDNLSAGSGTVFSDGEILDFEQALQATLLISSCPMSRCIGRIVGGKIRALDA